MLSHVMQLVRPGGSATLGSNDTGNGKGRGMSKAQSRSRSNITRCAWSSLWNVPWTERAVLEALMRGGPTGDGAD